MEAPLAAMPARRLQERLQVELRQERNGKERLILPISRVHASTRRKAQSASDYVSVTEN